MKILALDTSSRAASCAWMEDGVIIGEFFVNTGLTHSQTILPMVEAMLQNSGRTVQQADLLAVSHGPGSFTGLRIGIAAIKGMAMALDKPCIGVSTLLGLALSLQGIEGYLIPVMDARAGQVYTAAFRGEGGHVRRLWEDAALTIDDLRERLIPLAAEHPVVLVGDGATLCRQKFAEAGLDVRLAPAPLLHQRASALCLAAAEADAASYQSAQEVEPFYLRLPQAERERLAKESETKGQKAKE